MKLLLLVTSLLSWETVHPFSFVTRLNSSPYPKSIHRFPSFQQSLYATSIATDGEVTKPSKCPITKFSNKVTAQLNTVDAYFTNRFLRFVQNSPALFSLTLFGLISSISMMGKMNIDSSSQSFTYFITQYVGPTSNAVFSQMFPTLVSPASFVFTIWPIIAVFQLLTVSLSILFPLQDEFLNGNEIASLTTANLLSCAWLLISSTATSSSSLPLGCVATLPLVPFISSYPLRNKPRYILPAFQLYSSFTTLASFIAVAIELQHGGRIPWIGKLPAEISALVFLFLYSASSLAVMKKSLTKRVVNVFALGGILYNRIAPLESVSSVLLSLSFWGTIGCFWWAMSELFPRQSDTKEKKK